MTNGDFILLFLVYMDGVGKNEGSNNSVFDVCSITVKFADSITLLLGNFSSYRNNWHCFTTIGAEK